MTCLDTSVLIYFIKAALGEPAGANGDVDRLDRAKRYLERPETADLEFMVPTPVVGELLTGYPQDKWDQVLTVLQEKFQVQGLSLLSAMESARITQDKMERDGGLGGGNERQCTRTDALIIGIAITNKAEKYLWKIHVRRVWPQARFA